MIHVTTIKAIETEYKGYRFRSRMEARLAVMLDAMRSEWQYEIEGYELPSGRYLPDFLVRELGGDWLWIEVKGQEPNEREVDLLEELCEHTGRPGCFVYGKFEESDRCSPGRLEVLAVRLKAGRSCGQLHAVTTLATWPLVANPEAIRAARQARFEHGESGAPAAARPWPPAGDLDLLASVLAPVGDHDSFSKSEQIIEYIKGIRTDMPYCTDMEIMRGVNQQCRLLGWENARVLDLFATRGAYGSAEELRRMLTA